MYHVDVDSKSNEKIIVKRIQFKSLFEFAFVLSFVVAVFPVTKFASGQTNVDVEALEEEAVRKAVERVGPAVIRFETIGGTSRIEGTVASNGPSTGVVISPDGFVVSASFHFAHDPASIFARLPNGKRAAAEIVGRDLSRKIVLLKIQTDFEFVVPQIASSDRVRVGETVIALGRVFESSLPSISTGIVSAKNRIWDRAIQVDAKISPANFGGPLVNLKGEVVGILVPMSPDDDAEMAGTQWYDSGIGFAVPLDKLEPKFDQLKRGATLRQGLIGISLEGSDVFADLAIVSFCPVNSPAGKSGILAGDQIIEINGRKIRRQSELKHAIGPLYENDEAAIVVERDGTRMEFKVTMAGEIDPFVPPGIGVLISRTDRRGVILSHIDKGSVAESSGLKTGDRIVKFHNEPIKSYGDLRKAIAASSIGSTADVELTRDGKSVTLALEIGTRRASPLGGLKIVGPAATAKIVEIKVAEVANQCLAVIPIRQEDLPAPSLLVWIPKPGSLNRSQIEKTWLDKCRENNVVLLVPQSTDAKKWSPGDHEFVINSINTLKKRIRFDQSRIVVAGTETGGAMASIVAFSQRNVFQGLALIDANISQRIQSLETSPVQPLLIFMGTQQAVNEKQKDTIERLKQANFPVHVKALTGRSSIDDWVDDLLQWTVVVDRL